MPKAKVAKTKSDKPASIDFSQIAQELLDKVQIPGHVSVVEADDTLQFQIDTDEPGILIGFHGETLSAVEKILGLIVEKQIGVWKRVTVNVGDYRERREETLKNMALSAAQRVKFSGGEWIMPILSASERRLVHMALTDHPDVVTESVGEGSSRRLVIKPRSK